MPDQLTFDQERDAREARAIDFGREVPEEGLPIAQEDAGALASLAAIPIQEVSFFLDEVRRQEGLSRPHVTDDDIDNLEAALKNLWAIEARSMEAS